MLFFFGNKKSTMCGIGALMHIISYITTIYDHSFAGYAGI